MYEYNIMILMYSVIRLTNLIYTCMYIAYNFNIIIHVQINYIANVIHMYINIWIT